MNGPTMGKGTGAAMRVLWRTQWRRLVAWVVAPAAGMVATAVSVAGLYDTPAKIRTYAAAVGSGHALLAVNGKVEGVDSLGGVIENEFGFLAAFVMPLLGIALVARSTRGEEEAGRMETLLGGRVARQAPVAAALLLAGAAVLATTVAFTAGLVAVGVPLAGAALYAASLGALALVFATLAALVAQLVLHARGVYALSLLVLVVAYVLRGVGDVTRTWLTWLSPLGWAERAAPFGAARWWTLLVPLLLAALLSAVAVVLAARRDLGSSLSRGSHGPAHAASYLHTETGLAAWLQRSTLLAWLTGSVLVAAMMGSLARQLLDAMSGNPALANAIGVPGGRPSDGLVAVTQLYLAVIATGYTVSAVGTLREEETTGRLEPRLAGTLSRRSWLGRNASVLVAGLVVLVSVGSLVLALTTAWSLGESPGVGGVLAAGFSYVPAELTFAALALAVFSVRPRVYPLAWAAFAAIAFIALLGRGLRLPGWVIDLAPTSHVGSPPLAGPSTGPLLVLTLCAVTLTLAAGSGFRRRTIPST